MTTAARTHFANELVQCGARRLADELLRLVVRLAPHVRSGARLVCTCCVAASLVLADADGKLVWQCRSTEDVGLVPRTAQSPYVLPEQVEMAGGVSPKVCLREGGRHLGGGGGGRAGRSYGRMCPGVLGRLLRALPRSGCSLSLVRCSSSSSVNHAAARHCWMVAAGTQGASW